MNKTTSLLTLLLCLSVKLAFGQKPNVLLIIADDMGIDMTNGYQENPIMPTTPNLDMLRSSGLTYTNTWATPQCTPTRAAIMSGKYGINTGVMRPPGNLGLEHESLFKRINASSDTQYATALIGKWHISDTGDYDHPEQHGIDHYEGFFSAMVGDYYSWEKITNGVVSQVDEYATTHLTNASIDWIAEQNEPWLLWLAHAAPHSPFHEPPSDLYTIENTDDQFNKYVAAIEAMDHEIGRLIASMDEETLRNTVIIFIGDNGTPERVIQNYPSTHAKSTLYEGGVRVPMIISGSAVSRSGEIEPGLTQVTDLYATILELSGQQLPGGIHNSLSLKPSFSCDDAIAREYVYTDYEQGSTLKWAIRTSQYKLIEDEDGGQEFYDISENLLEDENMIENLTSEQEVIKNKLVAEAAAIRTGWSCNDLIKNGTEIGIDDCENVCSDVDVLSTTNIGCCDEPSQPSVYYEFTEGTLRNIYTNDYPNHSFCYNPNLIPSQNHYLFQIDLAPAKTGEITSMIRDNGRPAGYFGVAMNGVIMAPAPAQPFIFENPNTGEFNWDWVFEPTNNQGDGRDLVALDCSSAHTGPQGYHYHGDMYEYMETILPGITTTSTPPQEITHVGWAADGFPILYRFGPDANGKAKELMPSFQLKSGLRPGNGVEEPCGPYTGKYTVDYEYICGKGDLDECNGIDQRITITTSAGDQSFDYFYVVTSSFPQIPRCFVGNVSMDFVNPTMTLSGVDSDNDGFLSQFDCNDGDASINPNAAEIPGNDVDENCDNSLTKNFDLSELHLSIYPNPTDRDFRIACDASCDLLVNVFTIDGKLASTKKGQNMVEIRNLAPGTYVVRVIQDQQKITTSKIIVQ